jgi:hypothetical protein
MLGRPHPFYSYLPDDVNDVGYNIIHRSPTFFMETEDDDTPDGAVDLLLGILDARENERLTVSLSARALINNKIKSILNHPFLKTKIPDIARFRPIPYSTLESAKVKVTDDVLQDLCFIAYNLGEMYLCQSRQEMRDRLVQEGPCWCKRWAKMLMGWKQRSEMEWVDEVVSVTAQGVPEHCKR